MTPPCCFAAVANSPGGVGSPRPTSQQPTTKKPVQMFPSAPAVLLLRSHKPHNPYSLFFGLVSQDHRNRILSVAKFFKPLANLTRSWEYPFSEWFVVSGLGLMLRATPLNSCTLEYLLVDQVNFRLLWFGGVITVISTSLLSLDLCNTLRSFGGRPLRFANQKLVNQASLNFLLQGMPCGFGCGSYFVSQRRPAGDEWDL